MERRTISRWSPKIQDDLLEKPKNIGIDDAWTVLNNEGYTNQFEGNWKMVKDDVPVEGRALAAMNLPSRSDGGHFRSRLLPRLNIWSLI